MKTNMGSTDRIIRIIIALVAAYFAWKGDVSNTVSIILYIVAAIMLLTTIMGNCPLYSIFGCNTIKSKSKD